MCLKSHEVYDENYKKFSKLVEYKTDAERFDCLAQGFETLDRFLCQLEQEHERAKRHKLEFTKILLATWINEEAAKVALLFDYVRMPWKGDEKRQYRHLKRISSHKYKSIYTQCFWGGTGSYDDSRDLVKDLLKEFVSDSNEFYSWEYPNPLDTKRSGLYVDLVQETVSNQDFPGEERTQTTWYWNDPLKHLGTVWDLKERRNPRFLGIVHLLRKASLLDRKSLPIVHEAWAGFTIKPGMQDREIWKFNCEVLSPISAGSLTPHEKNTLCWEVLYPLWFILDDLEQENKDPRT